MAEYPEKLKCLFIPRRYKIMYGGRGGAKSWGVARALLQTGASKPLRILCTREVQKSIKESVHKLLSDQIQELGMGGFYQVYETSIRGANGTEFGFAGLGNMTTESIKSCEGVDRVWVEEAQTVSKRSWDILMPTIRKDDSEIWVTMNPDLETDDTYQRFVKHPPQNSFVVFINYYDNPWFPSVLEQERLHCKETDPDNYEHIWEGRCRSAVEGAIYTRQYGDAVNHGRITNVPHDPMLNVHIVCDLGRMDAMFISLVQKLTSEIRVIETIHGGYGSLPEYSAELRNRRYNWGRWWLPHDGYSKNVQTGKSSAEILTGLGWNVPIREEIVELSIEEGIKRAQDVFPRVYMDKDKTEPLQESLKRYRRRINRETDSPGSPLHDEFSHGADCFRYICLNADQMTNDIHAKPNRSGRRPPPNWRAV